MSDTMIDRESVIRQLTQHIARADYIETDWMDCVSVPMLRGALALLKEQEPRVLSANEIIKTTEVTTCYIEVKGERNLYGAYLQKYDDDHTLIATDVKNVPEMIATRHARLWSARPTDDQREAVKWDADISR